MNYFQKRRLRKSVQHILHESKHARHMREDIASPQLIEQLRCLEQELSAALTVYDESVIEVCAEKINAVLQKVYPVNRNPRFRENLEIIVVAISVAMAFRTFFIQPFRIPTGSMQPTLYGITYEQIDEPGLMDKFPLSIASFLLFGEQTKVVKAKASGVVAFNDEYAPGADSYIFRIAGIPHMVHRGMPINFQPGETQVKKGDVIAGGRKKLGDHIFVNRLWYNFFPPERGDIFVFSTRDIRHRDIRPDNYYIKRMVGMPGETISIDPPYLIVDGNRVTEPLAFVRQVNEVGYHGYYLVSESPTPALLRKKSDTIILGPDEYLPFGDNTRASLDGRFFGPVKQRNIIGPAFMVYWPFGERWGFVE